MATMHASHAWRRWLVALALVATLSASIAVETAAAATALPACSVGDTYTARRLYVDWAYSMLDTKYRLSAIYYPQDLVSTSNAGLAAGYKVRKFVIPDLKAMASAAKAAGAQFSVQSAFRSYATQKSTFDYWVKLHGYAYALKESARPGHSEHQMGTTLDCAATAGRRRGT